jgi:hypothetical protein
VICVYSDPMVEFGGRIVGGLRIKKAAAVAPAAPSLDDDIPF